MIRKIITIDKEKCTGCGLCVQACHEGAIALVNGKAELIRDDYCDGLGNCLPVCPGGAISFEEREAAAYDEEAVKARQKMSRIGAGGCPGSRTEVFRRPAERPFEQSEGQTVRSELRQWPVQLKLVPVNAPYFDGAHLLVAADCTAFAYGDFHKKFIKHRITLIGCPKLDEGDYTEKLTAILQNNDIQSVRVVRMQVPCCGGIENAVKQALINSRKMIPWQVTVISPDGRILTE